MTKMRKDNDVTNHTGSLYAEKKLNCHNRFDMLWSTMKCKQGNDMTDHTSAVYSKIGTELP